MQFPSLLLLTCCACAAAPLAVSYDADLGLSLTLDPGESAILYLSDYPYTVNYNAPALPNYTGFDAIADPSSVGGQLDVALLTYTGTPVVDLGSATILAGLTSYQNAQGVEVNAPIGGVSAGGTALTAAEQQALFSQDCPATAQFTGFPPSMCAGWFSAQITNTGSIPVVLDDQIANYGPMEMLEVGLTGQSGQTWQDANASGAPAYLDPPDPPQQALLADPVAPALTPAGAPEPGEAFGVLLLLLYGYYRQPHRIRLR